MFIQLSKSFPEFVLLKCCRTSSKFKLKDPIASVSHIARFQIREIRHFRWHGNYVVTVSIILLCELLYQKPYMPIKKGVAD